MEATTTAIPTWQLVIAGLGVLAACGSLVLGIITWRGNRAEKREGWSGWRGSVDQQLTNHDTWFDGLKEDIQAIRSSIQQIFLRLPPNTVGGSSPLRLTDLGEEVAKAIQADTWAKYQAQSLIDKMLDKRPDEIQDFCFEYVKDYKPDESLDRAIRVAAYNHGIDRSKVLDVLAIVLRDTLIDLTADAAARWLLGSPFHFKLNHYRVGRSA